MGWKSTSTADQNSCGPRRTATRRPSAPSPPPARALAPGPCGGGGKTPPPVHGRPFLFFVFYPGFLTKYHRRPFLSCFGRRIDGFPWCTWWFFLIYQGHPSICPKRSSVNRTLVTFFLGPPRKVPFLTNFFGWEGSPTKID